MLRDLLSSVSPNCLTKNSERLTSLDFSQLFANLIPRNSNQNSLAPDLDAQENYLVKKIDNRKSRENARFAKVFKIDLRLKTYKKFGFRGFHVSRDNAFYKPVQLVYIITRKGRFSQNRLNNTRYVCFADGCNLKGTFYKFCEVVSLNYSLGPNKENVPLMRIKFYISFNYRNQKI
jgi:hypothetical protein